MEESKSLEKYFKNSQKIDIAKWREDIKKAEEEAKRINELALKAEEERFSCIKCPVCKSTNKREIVKSNSNGIYGPGHRSWITEEYLVCNECGVMFKDLNKPSKG